MACFWGLCTNLVHNVDCRIVSAACRKSLVSYVMFGRPQGHIDKAAKNRYTETPSSWGGSGALYQQPAIAGVIS